MACAVGLFLAEVTRRLLVAAAPASIPRLADVSLDWHVLGFAAIVSLATGLGFGLLPAWQAGRARPVDALRSSERVVAGTWVMKWRNALMVVEVALSAILLTGAGLMLKSLVILNGVQLGFQPEHVLTANVNLPQTRYPTGADRFRFFDALAARLSNVPGVESVAFANRFPLRGGWETGMQIDGVAARSRRLRRRRQPGRESRVLPDAGHSAASRASADAGGHGGDRARGGGERRVQPPLSLGQRPDCPPGPARRGDALDHDRRRRP